MFLRTAFKLTSYFLLIKLIGDKLSGGKIKFQSIAIPIDTLRFLLSDTSFQSFFFSTVYDNRTLAKDKVALLGHVLRSGSSNQMEKRPLEVLDDEEKMMNDRNYSSYELRREDIQKIVDNYGERAAYFIFKPTPFSLDKSFVSYQVIPANVNKEYLRKNNSDSDTAQRSTNNQTGDTSAMNMLSLNSSEALGFDYEIIGRLNPSPPATANFEEEVL
jgi:hypothetical protein